MHSLSLIVSFIVAAAVAPPLVRALGRQGLVHENYRGARVPFPIGVAIPLVAMLALIPLSLLQELADVHVFRADVEPAVVYVLGVSLLGLLDDFLGSAASSGGEAPRGWRGHARAVGRGGFSTGAAKAAGSLGLALFALSGQGRSAGEYLLGAGVLVLATNLFNLLDLRPGRSVKVLLLLGAALTIGALNVRGLWTVGLFLGPVLVLLPLDLREHGMLGDTGSNAIGAIAGIWLVVTLSTTGQAIALAVMAVATVYGELRSISTLMERTPILRQFDMLGRSRHA